MTERQLKNKNIYYECNGCTATKKPSKGTQLPPGGWESIAGHHFCCECLEIIERETLASSYIHAKIEELRREFNEDLNAAMRDLDARIDDAKA